MNNQTRRQFLKLSAFGFGSVLFSRGLFATDSNLSTGLEFLHGVASGDPLDDRVIIWTRVSPPSARAQESFRVAWQMALDPEFRNLVNTGTFETSAARDFTIKVDAAGLIAGQTYYYRFLTQDGPSPVGITKTLPTQDVENVKLAVVSCSNYPAGRFHVYREVAAQKNLDAVLHLGDYIYEYQRDGYASQHAKDLGREVNPATELLTLDDYRARYALYRSDKDLQDLHQKLPFIAVWDDHEVANNSWKDGADNHQPEEGAFEARKLAAMQAYSEWMPLRPYLEGDNQTIYRSFQFGKLISLHMMDSRHSGRDVPLNFRNYVGAQGFDGAAFQTDLANPARSLLGTAQREWIYGQLRKNEAVWQVLGQQILMGRMYLPGAVATQQVGLADFARLITLAITAASGTQLSAEDASFLAAKQGLLQMPNLPYNLDAWDGFEAEREGLLTVAREAQANLVVLAGDTHNAWGNNLVDRSGKACGVEFATPSVTSPGLEDYLKIPALAAPATEKQLTQMVEGLKYLNIHDRGFMTLSFTAEAVTTDYIFVSSILEQDYQVLSSRAKTITVKAGANSI